MSVYIRLVSLCMFFYEQIEIEKKEEEKNNFILCHGNQFEIQKEKNEFYETLSCDGNSNCNIVASFDSLRFMTFLDF